MFLALDASAVALFVIMGRDSHDEGSDLVDIASIAAPFLGGLAIAWLCSPHLRRRPAWWRAGVDAWLGSVVIGMVLRRLVWDRGTALSFVIVTTLVLGALMLGWRIGRPVIRSLTGGRREIRSALPPSKAGR